MPLKMSMEIPQLPKLRRKLTDDAWIAAPWRDFMERMGTLGENRARGRAPSLTGRLRGAISHGVQKKPFPGYVAIRAKARNRRYPYPRLLNYSRKHGHFMWFTDAIMSMIPDVRSGLRQVGSEIASRWSR